MISNKNNDKINKSIWVVFTNQTELPWLCFLKSGFRHCFVIINDGKNWLTIDPMSSYMDIIVHYVGSDFDMPRWLRSRGFIVVKASFNFKVNRVAPSMIFTCVEACKRILGIHRRTILTPWQLYKYLKSSNCK